MPIPLLLHGKHDGSVLYEPFGPWIVPWRFTSPEEEYATLRTTAGLVDYSTQALIELQGADRASFLQRLLTNDIARLVPGTGCYAALLDPSAKLIAPLIVFADPDALWLMCDLPNSETVAAMINRYLFSERVQLVHHERRVAVLAIDGPQAADVVAALTGTSTLPSQPLHHVTTLFDQFTVRWLRHSVTGTDGILGLVPGDDAPALWELLRRSALTLGAQPVGWETLNVARIEGGQPWFDIDMDATNLLPETGLERSMVSDSKGCYIGQEIIARLHTYGSPNKKLMGLLVDGEAVPKPGERLSRTGEDVGWITSGCYSPALRRPIAMGYVKRGWYKPATTVELVGNAGSPAAIVVELPSLQEHVRQQVKR